jgi:hypothetical protein
MSRCQIFYTILLLIALGLFFGIFFGLGYPEIKRAEYISTYCTIDDKTILSKYCCYKECSSCGTANALAPKCTDLMSQWNSLSPEKCASAVLTNSSLANVCPISDLKGECNDGYYCCSECCSTCCDSSDTGGGCHSCNCTCCASTARHSCQIKCPVCYSVVLTVILQKRDKWSYTPIITNITTEFREKLNGAEQFLAKYHISSTVQCFYNSRNPFQALLNIDFATKTWVAVGITASFLTILLMYGTWYLFSKSTAIYQGYDRILIMEIALWCGTIIPSLLILIDLIPFTNGKVLWTLAVIGVALGWAPAHIATCMRTRGWSFISSLTVTIISLILPLIMFAVVAIYASNMDTHIYNMFISLAIVIPLSVNIAIFILWDLCVKCIR